jgi:hypothetical protein
LNGLITGTNHRFNGAPKEMHMLRTPKFRFIMSMAAGGLLGYLAASRNITLNWETPALASQDEQAISFEVLLPANATLEIDGNKTDATGATRTFRTPPLKEAASMPTL